MANGKHKTIEDIRVWTDSHRLVLNIYKLTETFPKSELFGLTSQLRRSASSIPTNIAEGFYRNSTRELIQFLYISRGSLGETKYHLLLSKDLNYIDGQDYDDTTDQLDSVHKQLNAWIRSHKEKL